MQYVLVGIGGAFGSLVRYTLGRFIAEKTKTNFPFGAFIINITGALLLGIVSSSGASSSLQLLLADGFLGAYTTFSTLMCEGFNLFKDRNSLNAVVYIVSSLVLGLVGFIVGTKVACFI